MFDFEKRNLPYFGVISYKYGVHAQYLTGGYELNVDVVSTAPSDGDCPC